MVRALALFCGFVAVASTSALADGPAPLRVGVFAVDASPPVGSPMAYNPTKAVQDPLSCRGVVLIGTGAPVVLCAVDWIGIANDGQREFREALAKAAGTVPGRVAVHALHQHDAPVCDFTVDRMLAPFGINGQVSDAAFERRVIASAAAAVAEAKAKARPVTHLGLGQAEVEKVASNRRVYGPDGKVKHVRYTACTDPAVRDAPIGTIDPKLRIISLWDGQTPVVAISYYATHPQSYYLTGLATPDFPGLARDHRQAETGVPHVHFNGAGGNIGAGKFNDGSHANRKVLTDRVADGMSRAWAATKKSPITAADMDWRVVPVALPLAAHLDGASRTATLENAAAPVKERIRAADELAWIRRCEAGETIDVACLSLGKARVLHMPGELFVEYQLAAQAMRPGLFVAMAAYGDYAPGYIGTEAAYSEGGYETQKNCSLVAPNVETVLVDAMRRLLLDTHPVD